MNLLAHALLSPDDPAFLVGNLTADWVKGRARRQLPARMQAGMALHQAIDIFTDSHCRVEDCIQHFNPRWGRYSPILVDILFDYELSAAWERYATVPRADFISTCYDAVREHQRHLPARALMACHHLIADDWLTCYASLDGIALSFSRLSARLRMTGHEVELAPAVADYVTVREPFSRAFHEFFPQLRAHLAGLPQFSLA
jgi:acyl carrier protein phosphodiesterase